MSRRSTRTRKLVNGVVTVIAGSAAAIGLIVLLCILYSVAERGIPAINWSFFTQMPSPPGTVGGGLANAIVGSILITACAVLMGIPLGLLAGTYLAEFGQESRLAGTIRFVADILMGAPSIVIGVFVYTLLVVPQGHFSGFAGSVALAIIMLPLVTRVTEDMLKMVPNTLRESALALGAPEYKMVFQVIFRSARSGLLTGLMLSVARVSGETAPLLFTALNSPYWELSMNKPMGNLTVTIFNYAMSPYSDWQAKAWGASLLITASVLLLNLTARFLTRERRARI